MDDDLHPVVKVIAAVTAIGSGVFAAVVTVVAFRGGTVPLLGWETDGGVIPGMFALVVAFPMISMVGYWLGMVVAMPLQWLLGRGRQFSSSERGRCGQRRRARGNAQGISS
jgi:hypothetical protein